MKRDAAHLRVVSWNVHALPGAPARAARLGRVADWLLADGEAAPDLALLQEVWTRGDADVLAARLEPAFERVDTPANWFGFRKGGLVAFVRRASGWRVDRDAERTRFHEFRAEAPDWRVWEGDGFGDKGVQRVALERGASDPARLVVLNTHLQAQYLDGWQAVRRAQFAEVESALGAVTPDVPVLLAGDLNTRPDEDFFRDEFLPRWIDLTEAERSRCRCGTAVPTPSAQEPNPASHWIDYVMARRSAAWRAEALEVARILSPEPDDPYSDHHGLDVRLRLVPARGADLGALGLALVVGPSSRRAWLLGVALAAGARLGRREGPFPSDFLPPEAPSFHFLNGGKLYAEESPPRGASERCSGARVGRGAACGRDRGAAHGRVRLGRDG